MYIHKHGQIVRDGEGQGGQVCCSPWDHKESDMTEQLNWTHLKHLLISRLQSPSAVILEPRKIKSGTVSTFPRSICMICSKPVQNWLPQSHLDCEVRLRGYKIVHRKCVVLFGYITCSPCLPPRSSLSLNPHRAELSSGFPIDEMSALYILLPLFQF